MAKMIKDYSNEEISCIRGEEGNLGEGSYGTVRLGRHKVLGPVACKCSPLKGGIGERALAERKVVQEIGLLQESNNENVVRVHGWAHWHNSIAIIMEYLPAGNLKNILLDEEIEITALLRLRMSCDIASGVACIHNLRADRRLIHGDIKPENILVTEDLRCKIADFGGARLTSYTGNATSFTPNQDIQYTELYAAPEMLNSFSGSTSSKYDTYGVGMTMHMILSREDPVRSQMQLQLFLQGVRNGKRPDLQSIHNYKCDLQRHGKTTDFSLMQTLEDVMKECWKQQPAMRPEMIEVRDRLIRELNKYSTSSVMQQVTIALRNLEIIKPSFDSSACVSLQSFLPPKFFEVDSGRQGTSLRTNRLAADCSTSNSVYRTASSSVVFAQSRRTSISESRNDIPSTSAPRFYDAQILHHSTSHRSVPPPRVNIIHPPISSNAQVNIKGCLDELKTHLVVKEATGYLGEEAVVAVNKLKEQMSSRFSADNRQKTADKIAQFSGPKIILGYMNVLTKEGQYPQSGCDLAFFEKARSLCWSATNASLYFSQECCKSGLLQIFLRDLKNLKKAFLMQPDVLGFFLLQAMSIIYNCSWIRCTRKYVKAANIGDLLLWYSKNTQKTLIRGYNTLAVTSVAALTCILEDAEFLSLTADEQVINYVVQNLHKALQQQSHDWGGIPLWALVKGLSKLALNPRNSLLILQHSSILQSLITLLIEGSIIEKVASVDLVVALAAVEQNLNQLRREEIITDSLRNLCNQSLNRELHQTAQIALQALAA